MEIFEDICRQRRLRVTPQRLEIYGELARALDHPTAEMLYQRLKHKMPSLSLDTVYRTLSTLVDHSLVHRVESTQNQARFEVQHIHHHHVVCRKCNNITDFTWNLVDHTSLQEELKDWGHVERAHMVIYGICKTCLRTQEETT
ncbi:MAG: transcriptional repressor [Geobacteraceae bacterium]|nr:transcriptional repressor [Geobacteraceae bacterium]